MGREYERRLSCGDLTLRDTGIVDRLRQLIFQSMLDVITL